MLDLHLPVLHLFAERREDGVKDQEESRELALLQPGHDGLLPLRIEKLHGSVAEFVRILVDAV